MQKIDYKSKTEIMVGYIDRNQNITAVQSGWKTTPEQMAELMAELRGEPETWERLKPGLVKMRQYLEEAWDCQEEASLVEELSYLCDLGKRLLDRLTNEEDYRRSDERSFLRRLQGSCAEYSVPELAAVVTFLCGIN